jgi:hypothetical protein
MCLFPGAFQHDSSPRVGAKIRSRGWLSIYYFKLHLQSSTHESWFRDHSALCCPRDVLYGDGNYDGQSSTTTHNIISTTRRFIRAMVVIPCRCHWHHVKDVRPAIQRCARRDRLSFPKVPSFCSLESPGQPHDSR